jgi:hypothetical protein
LLQGQPTLILLDELAPYFEDARSKSIGDSNLARVTSTALSNLLVAVGKDKLANVCVVISDLKATHKSGGTQLNEALSDFQAEVGRGAMTLEPVGLNTDEIYHILRTRLFEKLPDRDDIVEVAQEYAQAEIDIKSDRVTMLITEPYPGGSLNPDLQKYYSDLTFKNRILFLSGQRDTMDGLLETASEMKAIGHIIAEMDAEKLADSDPQKVAAKDMHDKIRFRLLSTARETFTTLSFPQGDKLATADFLMNFTDNNYNGEKQIREALKGKQKFTEDVTGDTFRKKCEARLFTQPTMLWSEVKKRAATTTIWQWHRADALDLLKDDLVHKDQWRESGGYGSEQGEGSSIPARGPHRSPPAIQPGWQAVSNSLNKTQKGHIAPWPSLPIRDSFFLQFSLRQTFHSMGRQCEI